MRSPILALLLAASSICGAQAQSAQNSEAYARKLLQAGMGRQPIANVRAVIHQRLDYNSSVMQQIKVEMSKSGKIHQLVLGPLRWQGMELVDDGRETRTFTPDDRLVIVQSSNPKPTDVKFRMSLVDRNYDLRIEKREKIAGRNAVVVAAVPKNGALETRCYAIDEQTGFLLRLDTCRENEPAKVHLEAKFVEFPSEMDEGVFTLRPSMGVITRRYERKCFTTVNEDMRAEVGFKPVVPAALPYGFAVQEFQADNSSSTRSLVMRLTDGLAKATVVQWQSQSKRGSGAPDGVIVRDVGTLRLLISGDLPDEVKGRLLDAFVRAARSQALLYVPQGALAWVQELRCSFEAFPLDREPQGILPISPVRTLIRI